VVSIEQSNFVRQLDFWFSKLSLPFLLIVKPGRYLHVFSVLYRVFLRSDFNVILFMKCHTSKFFLIFASTVLYTFIYRVVFQNDFDFCFAMLL